MSEDLRRTGFTAIHERLGARMVRFAGFLMPLRYGSITGEHQAVRERVGVFDVSHMGEFVFEGPAALDAVQRVTVNDASALAVDQAQYTAMATGTGGILDDCVVYRMADRAYMMVVNAANVSKDWEHVVSHAPKQGVELRDVSEGTSLLAVQGPRAVEVVAPLSDVPLDDLGFYWKREGRVAGVPAMISRTGYTGEDGFELYFDRERSETVWEAVLSAGAGIGVEPCGLGARDTLRLEMKYALYGNDIDESTNPYEAGLGWIVKLDKGDFVGREDLRKVADEGPRRRLVGFRMTDRAIPRPGYPVLLDGEAVGKVRSGAIAPSLGQGIGTCYLPRDSARAGTGLEVEIRGARHEAKVVKTPFYEGGSLRR